MFFYEKMNQTKSSLKRKIGKHLVSASMKKIDNWAINELNLMTSTMKYPIFVKIDDDSYLIGSHRLDKISDNIFRVSRDGKHEHDFYYLKPAVLYCVCSRMGVFHYAKDIRSLDTAISLADSNVEMYRKKFKSINTNTEEFKRCLWNTRYIEACNALNIAQQDLKKELNSTKYNKIWEQLI